MTEFQEKDWEGTSLDDFKFIDITPDGLNQFVDIAQNNTFEVRGKNYMDDKIKIPAQLPLMKMVLLELYEVNSDIDGDRHDHVCLKARAQRRIKSIRNVSPLVFVLNLQIPGDPPVSIVTYWALPPEFATSEYLNLDNFNYNDYPPSKYGQSMLENADENNMNSLIASINLFKTFINIPSEIQRQEEWSEYIANPPKRTWKNVIPSDITWSDRSSPGVYAPTDFRNQRTKIIPKVIDAPWVVTAAVRPAPVLMGLKVVQRYFKGEGYFESDTYVGSSMIADNIVGMCRSYTSMFSTNIAFVVQGESEDELPERLVGCVRLATIDIGCRYDAEDIIKDSLGVSRNSKGKEDDDDVSDHTTNENDST